MKNLYIFILFFSILFGNAFAQITITSTDISNFYSPGQTLRSISNGNPNTTMDVGSASSSSQNWMLPNVSFPDTFYLQSIPVASSPYASEFPAATHCVYSTFSDDTLTVNSYTYAQITSSQTVSVGEVQEYHSASFDTVITSNKTKLIYNLPITYNSSYELSKDTMDFGGGFIIISSSALDVDAFGKINLPSGNIDALRLTEIRKSETYFNNNLISSSTSKEFTWLTKNDGSANVSVGDTNASGNVSIDYIEITSVTGPTGVEEEANNSSPNNFVLEQNYPNPFNPSTNISYKLSSGGNVSLKIYNILGNEVETLVDEYQSAGNHSVKFEPKNLSSGIYFYKLVTGSFSEIKKMTLLK
ncbi:MAG: T9SS type A sorting domain-containing protein [Ignavibacteriaceae bacterium]